MNEKSELKTNECMARVNKVQDSILILTIADGIKKESTILFVSRKNESTFLYTKLR